MPTWHWVFSTPNSTGVYANHAIGRKIYMFNLIQNIKTAFLALAISLPLFAVLAYSDDYNAIEAEEQFLFNNLYLAENEQQGRIAEDAIWQFWFDQSPTTAVRANLDAGIERREAYDFETAEFYFDKVIQAAPNYPEGYNQRAFIRFLRENYDNAKTDLNTVLKLEPNHFGALSGMYHILQRQNRRDSAMSMLVRAVEVHPWIKERSALPEDLWPEHYRRLHTPQTEI